MQCDVRGNGPALDEDGDGAVAGGGQVNERLAQENKLLRTGMARLEQLMASNEQRVRNHTLEDIDRLLQDREVATLCPPACSVLMCVGYGESGEVAWR